MPDWLALPRYKEVNLAAELACGHIVWAAGTGWPAEWIDRLHCPLCDAMGEVGQWWFVP